MGVTFGQMEGLEMPYERIGSRNYEVRKYESYFVAEIECKDEELKTACQALERYIGRFCEPENIKGVNAISSLSCSPIASVSQQITKISERIPLRLPVIREKNRIQFVLPAIYTSFQQVPVPTNPRVNIRQIPERIVAVHIFYGQCLRSQYLKKLSELYDMLVQDKMLYIETLATDPYFTKLTHRKGPHEPLLSSSVPTTIPTTTRTMGVVAIRDAAGEPAPLGENVQDSVSWSVAQYHPRQTFRCLRRNEVWIDLDSRNPNVADLLYNA